MIFVESDRDLTRKKIWDFKQTEAAFWEEGRVELQPIAHDQYKVTWTLKQTLFR